MKIAPLLCCFTILGSATATRPPREEDFDKGTEFLDTQPTNLQSTRSLSDKDPTFSPSGEGTNNDYYVDDWPGLYDDSLLTDCHPTDSPSVPTEGPTVWPTEERTEEAHILPPQLTPLEAALEATLIFEFYNSHPPSNEDIAGIVEATQAFFNEQLLETDSPSYSTTYFTMEDVVSVYKYESLTRTARFEMSFLAKFTGWWCFVCGRLINEEVFAEFTLQTMRTAKYRQYIRDYARKVVPEGVFKSTRYVRFQGHVIMATITEV